MVALRTFLIVSAVAVVTLGVSGCREEEQDRALHFEKGVYSGQADTELTEEQRRALEQRSNLQSF